MKIYTLISLTMSGYVYADSECEITKEYREARIEAFKEAREPYLQCKNSMSEAYYWKAVAKCVSEGKGKNIGGGCWHLVSNGSYPSESYDVTHCDVFKVEASDIQKYFEHYIESHNIEKCKT